MQQIDPCRPCGNPPAPCPSLPPCGFLMQQIVASGRVCLRFQRFSLCLDNLPCGCQEARLCDVSADPCGVSLELCGGGCRGVLPATLLIPLRCALCRGCEQLSALSRIEVPLRLRVFGDPRDLCRAQRAANACVRLARPGCCDGQTAEAWLDVWAEAWLTACRPMYGGNCPPPCPPPLPLYPEPCRMR